MAALSVLDELDIHCLEPHEIGRIRDLNRCIFGEYRIVNRTDHPDLIPLAAIWRDRTVGFKVGYGISSDTFYSAKGGTAPGFRREGIATKLLYHLILITLRKGYRYFVFDTFPGLYPHMLQLARKEQFTQIDCRWNVDYGEYQIRLARDLRPDKREKHHSSSPSLVPSAASK